MALTNGIYPSNDTQVVVVCEALRGEDEDKEGGE